MLKVILAKEVKGLGKAGEVMRVRPGYARNFLIPRSLALAATPENLKVIEEEKRKGASRLKKERKASEGLAARLKDVSCTVKMKVGEDKKLYGAVTSAAIAESLKSEGIEIDKRNIIIPQSIKELGVYQIPVKLSSQVSASLKVWVVEE